MNNTLLLFISSVLWFFVGYMQALRRVQPMLEDLRMRLANDETMAKIWETYTDSKGETKQ